MGKKKEKESGNADPQAIVVQRSRYFGWRPRAVQTAVQFGEYVVVLREGGDLQVWQGPRWHLTERHSVRPNSRSLAQHGGRLFIGDLRGHVTEYAAQPLRPIQSRYVGHAVWALAVSPEGRSLYCACDDGHVRTLRLDEHRLEPGARLEPSGLDKVLSLAVSRDGRRLVAGGLRGPLAVYDTGSQRILHRVSMSEGSAGSVSVWATTFAGDDDDEVAVCGDSRGRVSFVDVSTGMVTDVDASSFSADVLCLARQGSVVFASGVDHKIVRYARSPNGPGSYGPTQAVRSHSHDVRVLLVAPPLLLSLGVDTQLHGTDLERFVPRLRDPLFPLHGPIVAAPAARRLLCVQERRLQLWLAGVPMDCRPQRLADGESLPFVTPPRLLAEIVPKGGNTQAAVLEESFGERLAWTDGSRIRVYDVRDDAVEARAVPNPFAAAGELRWLGPRAVLVCDARAPEARVVRLLPDGCELGRRLALPSSHSALDPIVWTRYDARSQWALCVTLRNSVWLWNPFSEEEEEVGGLRRLGGYDSTVTAADFVRVRGVCYVAVASANNEWRLIDPATGELAEWSRKYGARLPAHMLELPSPVAGSLSLDEAGATLLLHAPSWVALLDLDKSPVSLHPARNAARENLRILPRFRNIVGVALLHDRQLSVAECPRSRILASLPNPLYRKRFGV